MNELEIFKKRLIYRSNYRGTKEMDILLSKFVKKYIDEFNQIQLNELEKFLDFEDDVILDYYYHGIVVYYCTNSNNSTGNLILDPVTSFS